MKAFSWKALVALLGSSLVLVAVSISVAFAATAPAQKAIVDEYGNLRLRIVESDYTPTAADPNYDSGWHTHPGLAIVQVKAGTFDITQVGCTPTKVGRADVHRDPEHSGARGLRGSDQVDDLAPALEHRWLRPVLAGAADATVQGPLPVGLLHPLHPPRPMPGPCRASASSGTDRVASPQGVRTDRLSVGARRSRALRDRLVNTSSPGAPARRSTSPPRALPSSWPGPQPA